MAARGWDLRLRRNGTVFCFVAAMILSKGCGAPESVSLSSDASQPGSSDSDAEALRPSDDVVDEKRPPFFDDLGPDDIRHGDSDPTPAPIEPTPAPGTPPPAQVGKGFGVNKDQTCGDWVASHWKAGSKMIESAPGPLFTTISLTSVVKAVDGTKITVAAFIDAPGSDNDIEAELSFDACREVYRSALLPSVGNCEGKEIGMESVSVAGKTVRALKVSLGPCTDSAGKTFSSVLWRAPDYPHLGIVKREVTGTVLPEKLNGKLSPSLKTWMFQ